MRLLGRAAIATALLAFIGTPAAAQHYRFDFGINGGGSWYSSMLDEDELGIDEDLKFDAGWLTGAQATLWLSQRFGIRANMTYADRPLDLNGEEINEHINLWSGTGDLMFRFRAPNETWEGSEFLPYLALGAGGKWHNPAGDQFTCVDNEEGEAWSCQPFAIPLDDDDEGATGFALGEQKVFAGLVGLGADVRFHPNWAVRLEVNDRIYKPQVYAARFEGGSVWALPNGDENVSSWVHEVGGQVGLHVLLGLMEREVVAVVPAPPPPEPLPPPPPAPEPPPPPREEAITVCVIDPTVAGGIRMQSATFLVDSGDTVVVRAGERIPLREAVGPVMIAENADWYVRGTPFTLRSGTYSAEFVTYGTVTTREPDDIAFLGTINGFPVYADDDDVAEIRDELDDALEASTSDDLGEILEANAELREAFDDLDTIYVPYSAVGCEFQPLQRQEPVRKGGGGGEDNR